MSSGAGGGRSDPGGPGQDEDLRRDTWAIFIASMQLAAPILAVAVGALLLVSFLFRVLFK